MRSANSAKSWWYGDTPIMVLTDTSSVVAVYSLDDFWVVVSMSFLLHEQPVMV